MEKQDRTFLLLSVIALACIVASSLCMPPELLSNEITLLSDSEPTESRTEPNRTIVETLATLTELERDIEREVSRHDAGTVIETTELEETTVESVDESVNGVEWLEFQATFYIKHGPGMKGDGITYTGTMATEGRTIAVDPNVIPLGTRVYIDGYGERIAEDIGGAIKGNKIDIYVDDVSSIPPEGIISIRLRILEDN